MTNAAFAALKAQYAATPPCASESGATDNGDSEPP
jgi:hypothetical protein